MFTQPRWTFYTPYCMDQTHNHIFLWTMVTYKFCMSIKIITVRRTGWPWQDDLDTSKFRDYDRSLVKVWSSNTCINYCQTVGSSQIFHLILWHEGRRQHNPLTLNNVFLVNSPFNHRAGSWLYVAHWRRRCTRLLPIHVANGHWIGRFANNRAFICKENNF